MYFCSHLFSSLALRPCTSYAMSEGKQSKRRRLLSLAGVAGSNHSQLAVILKAVAEIVDDEDLNVSRHSLSIRENSPIELRCVRTCSSKPVPRNLFLEPVPLEPVPRNSLGVFFESSNLVL